MTPESEVERVLDKLKSGEIEEPPDVFEFRGTVVHPGQPGYVVPKPEEKPDA